jgi:hypothetical protein
MTEHNFGWRINAAWAAQMRWGENQIKIPLGPIADQANKATNADTDASSYMISVNGADVAARETHLGWIDWADARRIIMTIWPGNIQAGETVSLELKDAKILDSTAQQQTASARAGLLALIEAKIPQGGYSNASYKAYLDAYEKAGKVNAIADWPTALKYAALTLQAAIDGLGAGEDDAFTADFSDSSAYIRNTAGEQRVKGRAIAAVYLKSGALAKADSKPFDVPAGGSAIVWFSLDFSQYPSSEYDRRVFFWDDGYRPLAARAESSP